MEVSRGDDTSLPWIVVSKKLLNFPKKVSSRKAPGRPSRCSVASVRKSTMPVLSSRKDAMTWELSKVCRAVCSAHLELHAQQNLEKLAPKTLEKVGVKVVDAVGGRFEAHLLVSPQ